jgi:hypothetical protein
MREYAIEEPRVGEQVVTRQFLNLIDKDRVKEASDLGTTFIRSELRELSFTRQILPPKQVGPEDLDRSEYTDAPMIIDEKEPDSTATFVPFMGTSERTWFKAKRFRTEFGMLISQKFNQNKFNLLTYRTDIRQLLSDNSVKDLAKAIDNYFIDTIEAILAAAPTQVITLTGGLTPSTIVPLVQSMVSRRKPVGRLLMNKSTYLEALKLPATSVGDEVAGRHYDQGIESEEKLWGYPVTTTIKNDLVPDNVVYCFAPEEYFGKYYTLQDATLFLKTEGPYVEFYSYASDGIGIGNTEAVSKLVIET